ncbi:HPP family protein [Marinomonas sp. A79]|uniref:HPP family protein n=1 Tax=Marinomonas vulgaris TaxID=2823372 RepID=A0ABS5HES1_9GAMM|nr:HPP family protein [Marinomonas vulgaris]MBR7889980.1 HPP family protein [Marinomonas vulgaris]
MIAPLYRWIAGFMGVTPNNTSHVERFIAGSTACIALISVFYFSGLFLSLPDSLLVVSSIGASVVLLFAVPHGAFSQPWSFVVGHFISAAIGIGLYQQFGASFMVGAMAVGVSIVVMHYLNCLHPPGGSTALSCVIGGSSIHELGYAFLLYPLLLNLLVMVVLAFVINNAFRWRRYPSFLSPTSHTERAETMAFELEDLYGVLADEDLVIDISPEELMHFYDAARHKAKARRQPKPTRRLFIASK